MPLVGLPSTLECMLNALLCDNTLSSFKIDGRGEQTVVVLRLHSLATKTSTHSPVAEDSSVVYRRKCPSQVSRDKMRAEAYRSGHEKKASVSSPSDLFLPTPPSLCYDANQHERKSVIADVFSCTPCTSTTPQFSDDMQPERKQIDMSVNDTDVQAVTIDLAYNDEIDETTLYKYDGSSNEAECTVSESDEECVQDCQQIDDFDAEEKDEAQSEITLADIAKCIQEFRQSLKEVQVSERTVQEQNLTRDVS